MVSVEWLKPFEKLYRSRFDDGLGNSFNSDFDSLLDVEENPVNKDMEFGFTSLLPLSSHSLRHGRNYNTSQLSDFHRKKFYESPHTSSHVKVIPIKVEHHPDTFHVQRNTRLRFSNGPPKQSEAQIEGSASLFNKHLPGFYDIAGSHSTSSASSTSPKELENMCYKNTNTSNAVKKTDSDVKRYELVKAHNNPSLDKRCSSQKEHKQSDCREDKEDTWKPIPVQHLDSLNTPLKSKKSNINNNSSPTNGFPVPPFNSPNVSTNLETDENVLNDISFRNASVNTLPSISDSNFKPEAEEKEVNIPPSYPIYDILKVKLAQENRKIDYIKGDGNCFFRALSKGLYESERYYDIVRSTIVDIIATNKSKFAPFVDEEDVQEHVRRMSEDHCWATTCEIYAAATLLQKDIFMLTPDHLNTNYSWLLFRPVFKLEEHHNNITNHPCYITLCNTNGNHYDRIVPDHGGCNCFLPHPELGVVGTSSV